MGIGYGPRWTTKNSPASNVQEIINRFPQAKDGFYWINFESIGPQFVYCILNPNINGGGWMSLNSIISPQISQNHGTNATWETNTESRLMGKNFNILKVNVEERNCGDPSFYELKSPSVHGISYTETMLLMERISTIGQCSAITDQTDAGWYTGPAYSGSYTSSGMCTWGDGVFANNCCGAQNMTGLKPYWVILGSGTNPSLRYSVQCAGGTGIHYHMWFVK